MFGIINFYVSDALKSNIHFLLAGLETPDFQSLWDPGGAASRSGNVQIWESLGSELLQGNKYTATNTFEQESFRVYSASTIPQFLTNPTLSCLSVLALFYIKLQVFLKSDDLCLIGPEQKRTRPTLPSAHILAMHVQQLEIGAFTLTTGAYKWTKLRYALDAEKCHLHRNSKVFRFYSGRMGLLLV